MYYQNSLEKITGDYYSMKQRDVFFKPTTTSEEKSATESTDAEKQGNLTSCSESEEGEENEEEETLKEKIDRLALESSDEDEDFDVSNRDALMKLVDKYVNKIVEN